MAAIETCEQREKRVIDRQLDEEREDTVLASDPPKVTRFFIRSRGIANRRRQSPLNRKPRTEIATQPQAIIHYLSLCEDQAMVGSESKAAACVPQGVIEAILGIASDAIIASDADGRIIFWNPGATRIFGFTSQEAVGSSLDLIIPETFRERHWARYARVMATGEGRYGQGDLLSVPGLTKDGRLISVEFTIVLLHDDGGRPAGAAAIFRDVRRRFEEIRELRRQLRNSSTRDLAPIVDTASSQAEAGA
jgi:PAS domain S-box-containing protein